MSGSPNEPHAPSGPNAANEPSVTVTASEVVEGLVHRAAAGDRQAQAELLTRYRYFIRRAVRSRMGPGLRGRENTTDLEQQVAMEILASLKKQDWRGRSAFLSWLRQVARGEVIDVARYHQAARRAAGAEVPIEHAPPVMASSRSPESLIDEHRRFEQLERLLDELPEHQAQALVLFHQGHTHAEIGEILGTTAEAARKYVARARAKLAAAQKAP